ncbi:MAG: DUF4845 domain-containing protein [Pseudomonadales bacterium]
MNLSFRQRGLSTLGMLVVLLVAVFFGTYVVKVGPVYMSNATVRDAVESVVEQAEGGLITSTEIKGALSKMFQVNMIDVLDLKQIKVTQKDGKTTVDARYEQRVPLMFNIDVVVKFDNLFYEFSSSSKK